MSDYPEFTAEDIEHFANANLTPAEEANLRRSFADGLKAVDMFLGMPMSRPESGHDVLRASAHIQAAKLAGKMQDGIGAMMEARGWS